MAASKEPDQLMFWYIFEDPIIKLRPYKIWLLSSKNFDGFVLLGSYMLIGTAVLMLVWEFTEAILRYRRRNRNAKLPPAFWLFMGLALISLLITIGLRHEHKRIKYLFKAWHAIDLDEANRDIVKSDGDFNKIDELFGDEIEELRQEWWGIAERGFTPYEWRPYRPVRNDQHEAIPADRLAEKLSRYAKLEVRTKHGRLPFFDPEEWPKLPSTVEYFDLLIDKGQHVFWTAQWMLGFLAWAVYLSFECQRYEGMSELAFPLVSFGGLVSLAAAQSLLFAQLVLTQKIHRRRVRVPKRWTMVAAVLCQIWLLLSCVGTFHMDWEALKDRAEKWYDREVKYRELRMVYTFVKLAMFLVPIIMIAMPFITEKLLNRTPPRMAKRSLAIAWSALALTGCTAHIFIAYRIYNHTFHRRKHSVFATTSTHYWVERRNPMDHWRQSAMNMSGMLGYNLWVNALAFDTLLSALCLACWSVVARLDTRGMVTVALFPGMDWVTERVKIWRFHGMQEVRESGGLRGGGLRGGATRSGVKYGLASNPVEPQQGEEGEGEEEQPRIRRRPGRKASSRAPSEDPAPVRRGRGRPPKSAGSRAPSVQPEEPDRNLIAELLDDLPERAPVDPRHAFPGQDRPRSRSRSRSAAPARRSKRLQSDRQSSGDPESPRYLTADIPAFEDRAGQAEQAGLVLAMFALGGLGMASAAVYGADEDDGEYRED